jgi:hypothetical protein
MTESFIKGKTRMDELRTLINEYQKKKLPQTNHLFFTSNHDENSWNGTEYEKYGEAALCFAVFTATWNGLALVYSGQELPNNKRLKFFDKDPINWTGKCQLHDFYKRLFDLRSAFGQEQSEIFVINNAGDHHVFAFLKISRLKQVLVILNMSNTVQYAHINEGLVTGIYRDVFNGEKTEAPSINNHLLMEPWSFLVLEKL